MGPRSESRIARPAAEVEKTDSSLLEGALHEMMFPDVSRALFRGGRNPLSEGSGGSIPRGRGAVDAADLAIETPIGERRGTPGARPEADRPPTDGGASDRPASQTPDHGDNGYGQVFTLDRSRIFDICGGFSRT